MSDASTPNDELRTLVKKWGDSEVNNIMNAQELAAEQATQRCIEELEAVIGDND